MPEPLEAEAAEKTHIEVEWKGETFEVPKPELWPWEVVEAFDDGKASRAIRELLGPKQYRRWKSLLGPSPIADSGEFMNVVSEAYGIDPGE